MVENIINTENTFLSEDGDILKIRYIKNSNKINNLSDDIPVADVFGIRYQPIPDCHFVCLIPGIDSYLVKSVDVPRLFVDNKGKMSSCEFIKVKLHESITPSTKQLIVETSKVLIENDMDMTIKQLDPIGNVISLSVFKNIKIKSILMLNKLDYFSSSLSEIELDISFEECIVEY